jgi:RNA polymerase-binding protein DksA
MARTTTARATTTKTASKASATKKSATKPVATKPVATKEAAKKAPAKKAAAKKVAVEKAPAKKAAPEKARAAKAPAVKVSAKKAAAAGTAGNKAPAAQAAVKKAVAKKDGGSPGAKRGTSDQAAAKKLAVKAGEKPWTAAELAEVRGELQADRTRLRSELNLAEHELHDLMRDAGDGAGNDQADVGSTTFERDHEMSLANNARDMLAQTERALERIEDGTYGVCESCGEPIGKMRVMAFPRATLCLSCKQREERR